MVSNIINKLLTLFILVLPSFVIAQDTYVNKIGIEFVLIKPGTMAIGKYQPTVGKPVGANSPSPAAYLLAEKMAEEACMPGFLVTIDQPYYIGKFEITQEQWEKVMGKNPSIFQEEKVLGSTDNHPVDNITWKDAQTFVKKLNTFDKANRYRLPTEFEWEYAARAGAVDDISWTEIIASAVLSGTSPSAVGQKKPNAWGLYDMLGNLWEWPQDFYNEQIIADTTPPKSG
jgi:formylglycine-generating enzyme required for sulfatase activity